VSFAREMPDDVLGVCQIVDYSFAYPAQIIQATFDTLNNLFPFIS
jgi:hypothetical protein